jgi:hypothetical protein
MIEFRAELFFSLAETLMRDPELFAERRSEAEHAAEIVERIRRDEEVPVTSLRLYLGELRNLTFRAKDGSEVPGNRVVDPLWDGIVRWATVEQPPLAAAQQRRILEDRIHKHPEAERVLAAFEALGDQPQ